MAEDMNMTTAVQALKGYDAFSRIRAIDFLVDTYHNPQSKQALESYVFDLYEQEKALRQRKQKFTPRYDSTVAVYIVNKLREKDGKFVNDVYSMQDDPALQEEIQKIMVDAEDVNESFDLYNEKTAEEVEHSPYLVAYKIVKDLVLGQDHEYSDDDLIEFIRTSANKSEPFRRTMLKALSESDVRARYRKWGPVSDNPLSNSILRSLFRTKKDNLDIWLLPDFIMNHRMIYPDIVNEVFKNRNEIKQIEKKKGNNGFPEEKINSFFTMISRAAGYQGTFGGIEFSNMTEEETEEFLDGMFTGQDRNIPLEERSAKLREAKLEVYKQSKNYPKLFELIQEEPYSYVGEIIQMAFDSGNPQLQESATKDLLPLVANVIDWSTFMPAFNASSEPVKINLLKALGSKMDVMALKHMLIQESNRISEEVKTILEARGIPLPYNIADLRKRFMSKNKPVGEI